MDYGTIIKKAREAQGMTQEDLAAVWPCANGDVGASASHISRIESNKKVIDSMLTLRRLCDILDIEPWQFGLSHYDPANSASMPPGQTIYDQTLETAECLIKRTWNIRRLMSLPYVEESVEDLNRTFLYLQTHTPPPVHLNYRFQVLYAQLLRLNAVVNVEHQRYQEALANFKQMNLIARSIDHPATLAMSYMNIGTELERMSRQAEAIEMLERARDESLRASKHMMVCVHAYLARVYASAGQSAKFKRAIATALQIARDLGAHYGDGTDFVFHALSGVLAEKSYGHLEIKEPADTLAMKEEIKKQIQQDANIWLDAWIPLDWARAHLMLGQVKESIEAGQDFYQKAKLLKSPHALSRAYQFLNTVDDAGYSDRQIVNDFRAILDQDAQKNSLKELKERFQDIAN